MSEIKIVFAIYLAAFSLFRLCSENVSLPKNKIRHFDGLIEARHSILTEHRLVINARHLDRQLNNVVRVKCIINGRVLIIFHDRSISVRLGLCYVFETHTNSCHV